MLSSLLVWLHVLDMGLAPTLNRELAINLNKNKSKSDLIRSIEILSLVIGVIIFIIIFVSSNWLSTSWIKASYLDQSIIRECFILMGIIASFRFLEGIYKGCLLGLQNHVKLNIIICLNASLRGIGSVAVLSLISPTFSAFFIWQAIVSFISFVFLCIGTYTQLPFNFFVGRFSLIELKRVWRFTFGVMGITILTVFVSQFDKLFLSGILDLNEYGVYIFASLLAGTLFMLITPITQAFYPKLCDYFASNQLSNFNKLYDLGSQLVTIIVGTASILLVFYTEEILVIWTQDPQLSKATSMYLKILTIGNFFSIMNYMPHHAQLSMGWTSLAFKINFVGSFIIGFSVLLLAPLYGAMVVALTWAIYTFSYFLISIFATSKKLKGLQISKIFLENTFTPLISGLFLIYVSKLIPIDGYSSLTQFLYLILITLLVFITMSFAFPAIRKIFINNARS